ncbi:MAG: AAA family ATPase [Solirubrobacteraceae bacterium]
MSLRLERFELRAFGPFTATSLELRGAAGGALHIICGPNEVGKSTGQRGIGDFFFGIPQKSTDNQLHAYADMRLAAVLLDEDGRQHELVRRKGARSTLLGPDGGPVDEGLLESMLGGMTRDTFESMFSITHESLVVGGKALMRADGSVGESLFSASLGASGLHELRAAIEQEARSVFRPQASSSLMLQARCALEASQARLREDTLRATTFTEQERQLKRARANRATLAEQIGVARTGQYARQRLRSVIPLLTNHEQANTELDALADAPQLPPNSGEQRALALQRAASERQRTTEALASIKELEQRVTELAPDAALLQREQAIKSVYGRLNTVSEGAGDLDRQCIKLKVANSAAQRALERVRPDLDLEGAEQLRLTESQRAKVESALEHHAQLTVLLAEAEKAAEEAEDRARELASELDGLDAPANTSVLQATIRDAQADGQVEQRLANAEEELADAQGLVEAAVNKLHPAVALEPLRRMHPPGEATVEQFAGEHDELIERARELGGHRERLDQERRDIDEELARLALSANVPTLEGLATARSERDAEWLRLRRHLEDAEEEPASPDAFEGHLRHADDVADLLRSEANGVAQRTQLTVRERRLAAELRGLDEREARLNEERADHERRWTEAWSAVGVEPGTPVEMVAWLRARETVLERDEIFARRNRSVESEARSRDEHVEQIRSHLSALGAEAGAVGTLRGLLSMAESLLAEAQAAREAYAQLRRDQRKAQSTAQRQREKVDQHREALNRWEQDWTEIVAANAWREDVGADSARATLATVEELTALLQEVAQLTARVSGIEQRLDAFADDAERLVNSLAPELQSWPIQDAVAELALRLEHAAQVRSRREVVEEQLEIARGEVDGAERAAEQAEASLRSLMNLGGVASIEELPEVERRSARAAELRAQLPELERQITQAGQAPLDELIEQTEGIDVDALDAQGVEGDEELALLEEQLRQLDSHIGELSGSHQTMEHNEGAAIAAEHVEQRLAEMRELTDRFLHLYVSAWALSEAIDSYRREHKAPLLKRADELFPELTCGQFKRLEVTLDGTDEPTLVGVRANDDTVPVSLMSTGTREQLYLALRLASLERHVELHGPMPVILDDVVLHSDPKRKTAILRALAELGRGTQVIAFTHDPQVIALAQNAIDRDLLTVHELGGTEITGALQPQIAPADVHPIRPAKAA